MAVISGGLAPVAGRMSDRVHPRGITAVGIGLTSASLLWLALVMHPATATWLLLLPMALMGVGNAFMWGPLGATATRNLPLSSAGAGSGVYNTTRQVGAVLGSAAIAAVIQARLSADLPGIPGDLGGLQSSGVAMPAQVADGFASAMSESMLLPAAVLVIGVVAVLFFERPASHPH
jgi:MFS family permease